MMNIIKLEFTKKTCYTIIVVMWDMMYDPLHDRTRLIINTIFCSNHNFIYNTRVPTKINNK